MVMRRSHRGVTTTGRRLYYFPELKRCVRRMCQRGLTAANVVQGRWCSVECAQIIDMIPAQRVEQPPAAEPMWRNTAPDRREYLDLPRQCRR